MIIWKRFSPELKQAWISSLILDKPGEGRNEFFEVMGQRRGELLRDPNVAMDLLLKQMQLIGSQSMRYPGDPGPSAVSGSGRQCD